MTSLWRLISAERLKMSKSFVWLLTLLSPAIAVLPGMLSSPPDGESLSWQLQLSDMSMIHSMLFLPVLSGIFAALLCRYEHQEGGWKMLLALPVTRMTVYLSKFIMIIVLLGVVQLLFGAALLGVGWFREITEPVPWALMLRSVFGGWFACLPLAALQLAVSQSWSSFGAPLALNVSLTLPNMLIANSATYGPYYPWVQPMLAMSPLSPYGDESFGAFNISLESLLFVVLGSLIVFLAAGMISFWRKAV
ncbi:multidrug ABC transporter permease [Paenibacillus albidus]|uniref:Multidrug ABC transporter permease n=1 Tax=Paenibacillus albidus TaxID=2041023 RepID=A0A917C221_9BACL|nr:ABC transporter permease [Paenibacillus albidus]GGF65029.1 multidrug ABC transporter permease [Paenibacillus albidus]